MSYDKRWTDIMRAWLADSGVPDSVIDRHLNHVCQCIQDEGEELVKEIHNRERHREQAAYDAHIQRQLDEARGK